MKGLENLTVAGMISGIFYLLLIIATVITVIYGIVYFVKYKKIKKSIIVILTSILALFLGGKLVGSLFGVSIQSLYGPLAPSSPETLLGGESIKVKSKLYGPFAP